MDFFNQSEVPITVAVADLDELKKINDKYGHQMGDRLVREAANCLKAYANKDMIVARLGGDEFAILLPNASVAQVEQYIENVQRKMQQDYKSLPFSPIQVSIGYEYCNSSYGVMEQLLNKADANMYGNKRIKKSLLTANGEVILHEMINIHSYYDGCVFKLLPRQRIYMTIFWLYTPMLVNPSSLYFQKKSSFYWKNKSVSSGKALFSYVILLFAGSC